MFHIKLDAIILAHLLCFRAKEEVLDSLIQFLIFIWTQGHDFDVLSKFLQYKSLLNIKLRSSNVQLNKSIR
jgi:hypothetical protein